MNLLEHYILEVISKEKQPNFIKVVMRIDCWGYIKNITRYYPDEKALQKDLDKGYFLA